MRVLVTGATGYIGAHLVKALAKHGHTVIGSDFNLKQNDISAFVESFIPWDIRMPYLGKINDLDAVVHLAAKTKVAVSVEHPREFYETNVCGTMNVIDAVDTGHFLHCSTGCAMFPESSPYATSKFVAEDIVSELTRFSICRFFNVSGNDGFKKFDDSYYHLIRKAAAVANGLLPSISIYGTNYPTRDGTAVRNYSHVSDITDGLISLIDHGPTGEIENFGNTRGYSVREVISTVEAVSGKKLNVVEAPRRQGDIASSLMPYQSQFYVENRSLEDQCASALESEK